MRGVVSDGSVDRGQRHIAVGATDSPHTQALCESAKETASSGEASDRAYSLSERRGGFIR